MKRFVFISLMTAMCLTVFGCGDDADGGGNNGSDSDDDDDDDDNDNYDDDDDDDNDDDNDDDDNDNDEFQTYDIEISWGIGGMEVCESPVPESLGGGTLFFESVFINLFDEDGLLNDRIETVCDDYSYILDLEAGTYFVILEAMADYGGDYLPFYKAQGEIIAPAVDIYEFNLIVNTGEVEVSWGFDNFQMCGSNDVYEIEIVLDDTSDLLVDCNEGQFTIEDLEWSTYDLFLYGFNESGELTWHGEYAENPFEIMPGKSIEAFVELNEI